MDPNDVVLQFELPLWTCSRNVRPEFIEARVVVAADKQARIINQHHVAGDGMGADGVEFLKDGSIELALGGDAGGVMAVEPEQAGLMDPRQDHLEHSAAVALMNRNVIEPGKTRSRLLAEIRPQFDGVQPAKVVAHRLNHVALEGASLDEDTRLELPGILANRQLFHGVRGWHGAPRKFPSAHDSARAVLA